VSFDDWLMLQWSLGWTGFLEPSSPPSVSMALLEMTWREASRAGNRAVSEEGASAGALQPSPLRRTSLTFMLVCVPEPVWKTTSGKWSMSLPEMTWEVGESRRKVSRDARVGPKGGRAAAATAAAHVVSGRLDGLRDLGVEACVKKPKRRRSGMQNGTVLSTQLAGRRTVKRVDPGGSLLEDAEGLDQRRGHALGVASDVEVDERALGLRTPVAVVGDLERAERVGLGAESSGRLVVGRTAISEGERRRARR
jgi:hypothetical protein